MASCSLASYVPTRRLAAMVTGIGAVAGIVTLGRAAELADIVEKVEPSVVRIDTDRAIGSGVVVDGDGLVVTNYHVIEGSTRAKATFKNGQVINVTGYHGASPTHDLALLQLDKTNQKLVPLAISESLPRKGSKVAAFGNPIGLSFSASEGIVAAIRTGTELSQMIGAEEFKSMGYSTSSTWIQTTAAISGGNSGGPLVDSEGKLVGLNTWTAIEGQNLNFAIGSPDIKQLMSKARIKVTPLANLPRRATRNATSRDKFKLTMPSGRVFSPEIFAFELRDFQSRPKTDQSMLVLKHGNGALFALAEHEAGILHGRTLSFYESRDPMLLVGYSHGLRNGPLEAWSEAGKPVFYCQYAKGKRQGFCCLFEGGELAMIAEFDRDKLKSVQLMSGNKPQKAFASESEAEADETAHDLLKKLTAAEATAKTNELTLKREATAEFRDYKKALNKKIQAQRSGR